VLIYGTIEFAKFENAMKIESERPIFRCEASVKMIFNHQLKIANCHIDMSNVYNILFSKPAKEKHEMYIELEALAQEIVQSGKLRIDADEKINFVRFPSARNVLFFSHRELHDPKLIPKTIEIIGEENLEALRKNIKTNQPVPSELEQKIARLLVQATHPAIIKLILLEGVELFVSFSHNISDLLDLQSYKEFGSTGGMQSLGIEESRIFVSCGFSPFSRIPEEQEYARNATARFLVIAAQELGHYADIMRNPSGQPISRHSANLSAMFAKPRIAEGRKKDLANVKQIGRNLVNIGLKEAAKLEKSTNFFTQHRKNSLKHRLTQLKSYLATRAFRQRAIAHKMRFATLHSARRLAIMLSDMQFNLHPVAPAYQNENPKIEEAIICVEALARVPQQVVKWGHKTTQALYPNLYKIYYEEVIPSVIKTYENLTGEKFTFSYTKPKKLFPRTRK